MEVSSPGLLLAKWKKLNLEGCIICQNICDSRGSKKLTSADNRRRNLMEYSNTLQDNLLHGTDEHNLERIKYHVAFCYSNHNRKCDRSNEMKSDCSPTKLAHKVPRTSHYGPILGQAFWTIIKSNYDVLGF